MKKFEGKEVMKKANQLRAYYSVLKASLISTTRSIETIIFGFIFPLVFIMVFGLISGGNTRLDVALLPDSDQNNPVLLALESIESVNIIRVSKDELKEVEKNLKQGRLDGTIKVQFNSDERSKTGEGRFNTYKVDVTTTSASPQNGELLKGIVIGVSNQINLSPFDPEIFPVSVATTNVEGRKYENIDFILPGQLGFALLSTAIYSTAFGFINLRQLLVLKRFFATPVKKWTILTAEASSSLIFALFQSSLIIIVGALFLNFTLVSGVMTVLLLLLTSAIGLFVFMGFGFIVSGVAKNEKTASPFINLLTLPQFLLSGTFFEVSVFPPLLQYISVLLPLTHLNEILRVISFEGFLWSELWVHYLVLLVWAIVLYALSIKLFKWS